jgi:hypothetical protein
MHAQICAMRMVVGTEGSGSRTSRSDVGHKIVIGLNPTEQPQETVHKSKLD